MNVVPTIRICVWNDARYLEEKYHSYTCVIYNDYSCTMFISAEEKRKLLFFKHESTYL